VRSDRSVPLLLMVCGAPSLCISRFCAGLDRARRAEGTPLKPYRKLSQLLNEVFPVVLADCRRSQVC